MADDRKKKRPRKKRTDVGRTTCHCGLGENSEHAAFYEEQLTRLVKKKTYCLSGDLSGSFS